MKFLFVLHRAALGGRQPVRGVHLRDGWLSEKTINKGLMVQGALVMGGLV